MLHAYPYRETSLIVEAFTPGFGRVAMVARGAKRPRSETRGLLQAFQPLTLSWAGAGELKTLVQGRVARRPAAAQRLGAPVRVLPERASPEAARARGRASRALRRLRRGAGRARGGVRARGAGERVATVRGASPGGAGLRADAHARRRQRGAIDRGAHVPLRARARPAPRRGTCRARARRARARRARRDVARARGGGRFPTPRPRRRRSASCARCSTTISTSGAS